MNKKNFELGDDELLAVQEGKIREGPFFKVQSGKKTSVPYVPTLGNQINMLHRNERTVNLFLEGYVTPFKSV